MVYEFESKVNGLVYITEEYEEWHRYINIEYVDNNVVNKLRRNLHFDDKGRYFTIGTEQFYMHRNLKLSMYDIINRLKTNKKISKEQFIRSVTNCGINNVYFEMNLPTRDTKIQGYGMMFKSSTNTKRTIVQITEKRYKLNNGHEIEFESIYDKEYFATSTMLLSEFILLLGGNENHKNSANPRILTLYEVENIINK